MKYLPLIWANLRRKPLRMTLTIASIAVAFLLFGVLAALRSALTEPATLVGQDRLITINSVSIIQSIPASYEARVQAVPGVKMTCSHNWFGGVYQEDRNQIGTYAVEGATFFQTYPEMQLAQQEKDAWMNDRTAVVVGSDVARRFGWKTGDTIPMRSNIFVQKNGSSVWAMKIAGIYTIRNGDNTAAYFHYEYFNEALSPNFGARDTIGWLVLRIADPNRAPELADRIDAMFANSSVETKTTTEQAFAQGFANQMGNIGAIITGVVSAVFFTMLLVTANTMAQSVRERINELAVMKTLGFSSAAVTFLVAGEAILITGIGGAIGLFLAGGVTDAIGSQIRQYFPVIGLSTNSYIVGVILIIVLGALAALLPCMQAFRLKITDALRHA